MTANSASLGGRGRPAGGLADGSKCPGGSCSLAGRWWGLLLDPSSGLDARRGHRVSAHVLFFHSYYAETSQLTKSLQSRYNCPRITAWNKEAPVRSLVQGQRCTHLTGECPAEARNRNRGIFLLWKVAVVICRSNTVSGEKQALKVT